MIHLSNERDLVRAVQSLDANVKLLVKVLDAMNTNLVEFIKIYKEQEKPTNG